MLNECVPIWVPFTTLCHVVTSRTHSQILYMARDTPYYLPSHGVLRRTYDAQVQRRVPTPLHMEGHLDDVASI